MLTVHKMIDLLLNKGGRSETLMPIPGVTAENKYMVATILKGAAKFDFGELLLEPHKDVNSFENGSWALPHLTEEEMEMWREGYIPLPFKACWYEFELGGTRSGLVVINDEDTWRICRLDMVRENLVFDACWIALPRHGNGVDMQLSGNEQFIQGMSSNQLFMNSHFAACGPLAVYLSLMLNSRTTETHTEEAPTKLNKKRGLQGKTPLYSHRVVRIVPRRFTHVRDSETHEERLSPRLHWRRTHVRTYADGHKVVIARMLVGRAENGTVSHEYRIGS